MLSVTAFESGNANDRMKTQLLSDSLAVMLPGVYAAGLVFTFFTNKHLSTSPAIHSNENKGTSTAVNQTFWSKRRFFLIPGISLVGVVVVGEILVGSVDETGNGFGFGKIFVGAIIVGIVGNDDEHSSAIFLARKGKVDLSIGIAAGSGTQIALFVVPILVFAGIALGQPITPETTLY